MTFGSPTFALDEILLSCLLLLLTGLTGFDWVLVALSGAAQVPAIRLPRYPLLQVLVGAICVADSTILLSCPHIPLC